MVKLKTFQNNFKGIKNLHWRFWVQNILLTSCFWSMETFTTAGKFKGTGIVPWAVCTLLFSLSILVSAIIAGKFNIGRYSNIFTLAAVIGVVFFYFNIHAAVNYAAEFIIYIALGFNSGIRYIDGRKKICDKSITLFLFSSIMLGNVLAIFVFSILPAWVLAIVLILTLFNPRLKCAEEMKELVINDENNEIKYPRTLIAVFTLTIFFLLYFEKCLLILFDSGNFVAVFGYLVFAILLIFFSIRKIYYVLLSVIILSMLMVMIPMNITDVPFFLYPVIFSGGSVEIVMFALPVFLFPKTKKYYPVVIGGVLLKAQTMLNATLLHFTGAAFVEGVAGRILMSGLLVLLLVLLVIIYSVRQKPIEITNIVEVPVYIEVPKNNRFPDTFSAREREIGELLLTGLQRKEIADKLCLSENTIKKHLSAIYEKAGCATRHEFYAKYYKDKE